MTVEEADRLWRSLTIPAHVVWSDVDADLVLFDSRSGDYLVLDRTASEIWRHLARGTSFAAMLEDLHGRYRTQDDTVATDILDFVGNALQSGILQAPHPAQR